MQDALVLLTQPGFVGLFGVMCGVIQWKTGRHIGPSGGMSHRKVYSAVMNGGIFYLSIFMVLGQWVWSVPISTIVSDGIGNPRMALLLSFTAVYSFVNIWNAFQKPKT